MDRSKEAEEIALADSLLEEWYEWTVPYKPHLGYGRCAPECRQAVSSRQYDEPDVYAVDAETMKLVEYCVHELASSYQIAIGLTMKNRRAGGSVWRNQHASSYAEALEKIMPFMRKKNLL